MFDADRPVGDDPSKAEAAKLAATLAQEKADRLGRPVEVRTYDHEGRHTATRYFNPRLV